jgi:hypothetical protein
VISFSALGLVSFSMENQRLDSVSEKYEAFIRIRKERVRLFGTFLSNQACIVLIGVLVMA